MNKSVVNKEGGVSLEIPEGARLEVGEPLGGKAPAMSSEAFDPFQAFKTEPDKYHYRALNVRPFNLRERQAQGYETIPKSEFGDLILGKIPLALHKERIEKEEKKTQRQTSAAADRFKMEAEKRGVKTFEE